MGDFVAGIIASFIPMPGEKRLERAFWAHPKIAWAVLGILMAGAVSVVVLV